MGANSLQCCIHLVRVHKAFDVLHVPSTLQYAKESYKKNSNKGLGYWLTNPATIACLLGLSAKAPPRLRSACVCYLARDKLHTRLIAGCLFLIAIHVLRFRSPRQTCLILTTNETMFRLLPCFRTCTDKLIQ